MTVQVYPSGHPASHSQTVFCPSNPRFCDVSEKPREKQKGGSLTPSEKFSSKFGLDLTNNKHGDD